MTSMTELKPEDLPAGLTESIVPEPDTKPVADSVIVSNIQSDGQIRARVVAILREYFWQNEDADVRQQIPLEDVMWGVASNPALQQFVRQEMKSNGHDSSMTSHAIIAIDDNDLRYTVLTLVWPRLNPSD